jgi:flagellar biosynthesis component FlhA
LNTWIKKIGLGSAEGLVIGPLLGLVFIKIANVAYLETDFAFGVLIVGLTVGVIICLITVSFLDDTLTKTKPSIILWFIFIGLVLNMAETIIILHQIIP